ELRACAAPPFPEDIQTRAETPSSRKSSDLRDRCEPRPARARRVLLHRVFLYLGPVFPRLSPRAPRPRPRSWKKCYHTAWSLQSPRLRENLSLNRFHLLPPAVVSIVKTMQMEQTMSDIEAELVSKRASERTRIAPRHVCADENLAMLKCNHVGRAGRIHELAMQIRDFPVGHN